MKSTSTIPMTEQAAHPPSIKQWIFFLIALAAPLLMMVKLILDTNGQMIYTLDDPYIHLTLARNIQLGHYGINSQEFSAPSSSILWPFLLAPFGSNRFFEYAPLFINLVSVLASGVLIFRYLSKQQQALTAAFITLLVCVSLNYYGLAFTGMEHSLQVLLVVWIAFCCMNAAYGRLFWLSIVLLPLVRYEGLAITVPVLIYFIVSSNQRKQALIALVVTMISLVLFSLFLDKMGLGYLPSSIEAKSVFNENGGHVSQLLSKLQVNLRAERIFLLLTAYTLFQFRKEKLKMLLWIVFPSILHLAFGATGWYGRYEVYYYTWITLLLLSTLPPLEMMSALPKTIALAVVFLWASKTLFFTTMTTPFASRNIHDQQEQMALIARDYLGAPVAVNDLGLVSFRSNQYVLDLWGLGSKEALYARVKKEPVEWIDRLMQKHNVDYAIIYESWFKDHPQGWVKVATLHLPPPRITPADDEVTFYATNSDTALKMKSALLDYRAHSQMTGFYLSFE
jgi:hypothetical protein